MSFNYNNEVLDLLLKKTLGSAYTSADLVSGQETPVLPKIQNSQIFTNRITDANASNFTWSSTSNVAGGGTVSYLDVVTGETSTFQYIKKYEAIPMSVVAGTNNRAWKPTDSGMQEKFENVISGKPNFNFSITTDITNYGTIYSTNSGYKPVINNGVLVFLGNSVPASTTVMAMKEVYIYEGAFGTTTGILISDISNVNITSPQDGQALVYDNATQKWIAGTVGADYIPISTLETLDDVSLNNLNVGQTISYDGFKWVPTNVPQDLSDISDVDLTGATAGQAIVYDGATNKWKPGNVQTPLIQLGDISDVKFDDGPYDGQGLVWKDVSSCWIAKDIQTPLNSLDDVSGIDLSGIVPGQTIVLDISGIFVPKSIGEVIENLSDLKDVDVSNLADQIPQWTQKNRLEASDAAVSDNFGFSSALDISYSLVGAPNANSSNAADVGKAYLYKKNFFLGTYSEDQVLMSTIDGGSMNFGNSVSIGRNILMVGAPNHSYNPGSGLKEKAGTVFFYNYSEITEKWGVVNGSVYNENSKIQPGVANDQFGFSLDIDVSNNWCIIGSPQKLANGNGKADIYENVSGTWTHRKTITASDGAGGDNFGVSVRINDENTFAFVGADNHSSAKGAVYIYKKNHPSANSWGQYQKVISLDERINSYFGKSIGVHKNTLLIGSPNGGNFSGAVYEVTYSTGTGKWGTQSGSNYLPSSDKIVALDASANDQYGYSVDAYENFGVVGSKSTDMSGNVDTGSAYIVINTGEGYWEESKQINPDDLDVQDEYGISVSIFGRSVVIGSWLSEGDQGGDPAHAGSAYIFNLPNPEGGTKALIYDTDYNRWKVGSVAPSDEAVVTKLGLLEDVDVTTIANDNVLAYNDASGNWKPASMGSLITIGDISDVDLSGVATGKAIIWDASLNKWIIGDGGGGAASGVTSTNIQPTVDEDGEPLSAGRLYYDTSWNSFHGRTTDGWQELLLSNTNILFGAPAALKKSPYLETLLIVYPDRYEFTWENPPQYSTGFSASNTSDYVNGDLYLPAMNHIKFEYFKTSENQTWGSTSRGVVTIGGKSGIGRGSINGNTTQTLTNAAGTQKITNKLILYSTGSGARASVSDGWTNINTASGGTYEYDFIDIDASGNQVYHFNPRSGNFSIQAQEPYSFRMWVENSVTPHNYRYWNGITTQLVPVPSAIKVADAGQTNGFYAEIIHTSAVHKIKVVIPPAALTAAGVEVTQGGSLLDGIDNSVFFEAYEVQYQTVNAVTNENVETSAITGWTGTGGDNWTGEEDTEDVFDEGTAFSTTDHYAAIPADTPLQNKNSISADVYKHITINQFDNKFYRFRVRAKNQVGTDFGPWSTDYYVVRFTRPQKMAWNTNNPPLFLTKSGDPDKWFITLTWQDTKSSNGGVATGDDDWTHNNLAIAEYKLTRSVDNGSSYTVVDTNDYLSLDGNKRMKYYECDTLYSIFDALTENTNGWYISSEISASNKALLLDTSKYTYTNCFDGDSDNIIYYRRVQNNKCEVYTGYIDVPDELTYAFVNKNVFAGGMAMLILDLNNNHIFSYKFNSETGSNGASTSIAEVTLNNGRYKLFVYAFGEGYYNNLWSSIFVWQSENFASHSTPTWSYNGYNSYLSWVPTSGYYHNGTNYAKWKVIRNDYNESGDLKFYAADNITSFFRNDDTSKLTYDYCVASASDTTQKWSNPQYKFKIEARNYLFGTGSNDASAWSTISDAGVTLTPTTPTTPTHLQLKFYEQSQKNTSSNSASYYSSDPWTAPSNDYILYQWDINFDNTGSGYGTADYNGVTVGTANKLTPEQYQLEYLVGKANISGSTLRLVPTTEATGNYDDFRNTELLANDYYRLGTGTTVYQVSSVSSDVKKHILNHTGSETGIVEIYKVLYINATDKNLPGANPYYTRVYNVDGYVTGATGLTSLLRNASWTYTVKGKNYFVSTASSGFTSPSPYAITSPSNVKFISSPTIDISNDQIFIKFNEPDTSAKTTYANNPEIFNTPDAIDYKSYEVEPFINNATQSNRYVYTTVQSATRREVAYGHTRASNSNALSGMTEGATSVVKYKFRPEHSLYTIQGDVVETEFKILKPAPTDMDAIPLFEWQSDGTNNIKLTLRRSDGGLEPNTSNSNTGSTICPVTSLSSTGGDTATMLATTDELYWQVKSSTSFSGGITTTYTDIASQGWSNTDYVIANIGTMANNTIYTINFRLKNRYISDYKESLSPKIKLTTPNAPTEFAAVVDIVDDNAGNDNKITFNWTRPSEPGLHYKHDGASGSSLTADPDTPYIQKYQIKIMYGSNIEYIDVTGGSASARAPQTWTVTGSQGSFNVEPDTSYTFMIRAFNVRLPSNGGDWSTTITPTYVSRTRVTANIGVPYTIADNDKTYDAGLKVSWSLGGNYAYQSHATLLDGTAASNVKNWNTITNETANIGPILMNRHYNKPGTGDFASFYIRFQDVDANYTHDAYPATGAFNKNSGNGDHLTQVEKQPHNESTHANVSGKHRGYVNIQTMADLFTAGYNNQGQWYKVSTMHFGIIKNNVKDYWSGMKMNAYSYFYYKNSANATVGEIYSTICTNQYFDNVNSASSISGTPTVSYTPYKVTGVPTLYPGKTQTVRAAFVIDNKSEHYVNSDYISRVNLIDKDATGNFNGIMNYMNHEWKRGRGEHTNSGTLWTANAGFQAIGGANLATTSTSGITSSNTIVCKILHKNIYGDGTSHNITISGNTWHYFIYDKETYQQMDLTANRALSFIHLEFTYAGAAAHTQAGTLGTGSSGGYLALTILNPPDGAKFNPSTETTNAHVTPTTLTSSSTWSYGIFDGQTDVTSSNCNGLVFYRGKFMSPTYLKSAGTYAHGTTTSHYHSSLATLFTNYATSTGTAYNTDYKWAFYKYRVQNGDQQGVAPFFSKFYLSNGNNTNDTNIDFADLTGANPNVKICMKTMWNSGSTIKLSGWNQFVSGSSASNPGQINSDQLSASTNVPGTTNNLSWTGNVSGKNVYYVPEMGSSYPDQNPWRATNRKVAFWHAASDMDQSTGTMFHIIAIGIRNNANKYVGDIFIDNTYS